MSQNATISPECRAFLMEGTRTGKIATVRADGRPHVVPIWFEVDGNAILFTTGQHSVKAKNIRRDNRICFTVDEDTPPYSFALIDGTAELIDDPEELLKLATRLGGRYMGQERAEEYGKRNAVPGEVMVRITPTKVRLAKDIAN